MAIGDEVQLISHNHPAAYPSNAYVRWRFQDDSGSDRAQTVYHVIFRNIYLGPGDFLRVGHGWDPTNSSAIIKSFGNEYVGRPVDLFLNAGNIFFEFYADSLYQWSGFRISVVVANISGKKRLSINWIYYHESNMINDRL